MDEFGKEVQRFERFTVRCVFFHAVCVFVFSVCFLFGDVGATYPYHPYLGVGSNIFIFSPLLGEDSQFD